MATTEMNCLASGGGNEFLYKNMIAITWAGNSNLSVSLSGETVDIKRLWLYQIDSGTGRPYQYMTNDNGDGTFSTSVLHRYLWDGTYADDYPLQLTSTGFNISNSMSRNTSYWAAYYEE